MASSHVDRDAKVINGYAVMSLGEAKGHGMIVDDQTLNELVALGNANVSGVKTRVRHADPSHDGFGRLVGKSKNFRREGDKVVADLHVSEASFKSPEGDLGSYVMELAESADDTFGASPEVRHFKQRTLPSLPPAMRLKQLMAIAIVDDPATNTGFFSAIEENDMADNQVAELTAERDLLSEEVVRLKAEITTIKADLSLKEAAHVAALSAARTDAIAAERNRVGDIIALCSKANKTDLVAKHIADGTAKADLQSALFDVLCASNKAVGDVENEDLTNPGPDAQFKAEYAADRVMLQKCGITEEDYLVSRRISAGVEPLISR